MKPHIDDLGTRRITINGIPATTRYLEVRVQPGGLADAQHLVQYGDLNNVVVILSEFP